MLSIKDLHASVEETPILKGVQLEVKKGEVHAIMGPNGSGKSTLSSVIAGREEYEVEKGSIDMDGQDILELSPEERAHLGIFLSFQYPVEIPGVSVTNFLKTALNETRKARGQEPMSAKELLRLMREKMELLEMDKSFLSRSLNEGFSGGEKKRNEIFQMALMEPRLAILDETDSGLDIDALRIVANGVNHLRSKDNAVVLITHYQRLLEYIKPDFVHVLYKGRIVKSGGSELALELEAKGYDWIKEEVEA
ncbi:MAG: putative ATP-dependent transporter SufC [Flavobacteriia bacterium]|nr:MAG: putative ATP-dependent transporter SufC [Flavobacteriia bacterium]